MKGKRQIQQELRVAFRVDASTEIGTGHVMRCLTLADALSDHGARSEFICRAHDGHLISEIQKRGYHVIALPKLPFEIETREATNAHAHWLGTTSARDAEDTKSAFGSTMPDWLIVDHYGLDARWENIMRPHCAQMLAIDDLADRTHACDLLLDYGLEHSETIYAGWVSSQTQVLCGPQYALLRPEFAEKRDGSLARRRKPALRHILISMGGVDKENVTGQILAALSENVIAEEVELTVAMGQQAPWMDKVRAQARAMKRRVEVLVGTDRMAELMYNADLAIGGAGTTSWERCCLGLPSAVLVLADNQKKVATSLARAEAAWLANSLPEVTAYLAHYTSNPAALSDLSKMSRKASRITDGRGAAKVATFILSQFGRIRPPLRQAPSEKRLMTSWRKRS